MTVGWSLVFRSKSQQKCWLNFWKHTWRGTLYMQSFSYRDDFFVYISLTKPLGWLRLNVKFRSFLVFSKRIRWQRCSLNWSNYAAALTDRDTSWRQLAPLAEYTVSASYSAPAAVSSIPEGFSSEGLRKGYPVKPGMTEGNAGCAVFDGLKRIFLNISQLYLTLRAWTDL